MKEVMVIKSRLVGGLGLFEVGQRRTLEDHVATDLVRQGVVREFTRPGRITQKAKMVENEGEVKKIRPKQKRATLHPNWSKGKED